MRSFTRVVAFCLTAAACGGAESPGPDPTAALFISTESHDFGSVVVGGESEAIEVIVTNSGLAATGILSVVLEGATPDEFGVTETECEGRALPAAGSCRLQVWLRPAFSGAKEATLSVRGRDGEAVALAVHGSATGSTLMLSSGPTLQFPDTWLASESPTRSVLVRNLSPRQTAPLSVQATGDHVDDFRVVQNHCDGAALAPGASCSIEMRFRPTASGLRTATITVAAATSGTVLTSLRGIGGERTFLSLAPAALEFGDVRVGAMSTPLLLTVTNTGPAHSGTMTLELDGPDAGQFVKDHDTCTGSGLAPGGSCTVGLRFRPASGGVKSGSLLAHGAFSEAVATDMSGNGGIIAVALETSPSHHAMVGSSFDIPITVLNVGTMSTFPLRVAAGDASFDYYAPPDQFALIDDGCSFLTLAPGSSCMFFIRFAPASVGDQLVGVSANALGGFDPWTFRIIRAVGTGLAASASVLSFSAVAGGSSPADQTVLISNTSSVAATGAVTTSIDGNAFSIAANNCSDITLAPSATCSITIRFAPLGAGLHHGSLTVSAQPGGTYRVALRGEGL